MLPAAPVPLPACAFRRHLAIRPLPSARSLVSSSTRPGLYQITTPPTARKRKASDLSSKLGAAEGPRKKKTPEAADTAALPATPVTSTSANMDSDDDFNSSQVSEDEFMDDQDSDVSLGDGKDGRLEFV